MSSTSPKPRPNWKGNAEIAAKNATSFMPADRPSPGPRRAVNARTNASVPSIATAMYEAIMGLDHVDTPGSTMEPSAPIGETRKRILDSGTGKGFCVIYPKGSPPMPCDDLGQLQKKVIAKKTAKRATRKSA